MLPQKDPYLSHHLVHNQLKKQVNKESELSVSYGHDEPQLMLVRPTRRSPGRFDPFPTATSFVRGGYRQVYSICLQALRGCTQDPHRGDHGGPRRHRFRPSARRPEGRMGTRKLLFSSVSCSIDLAYTDHRSQQYISQEATTLIDPNTPTRSIAAINFPGMNHASTHPLREGYLERKKRFTKKYTESYYVLTPSGYLHERRSPNAAADTTAPGFSLFLPECSLSAPSKPSDRSHKFHCHGNRATKSSAEAKIKNTLRFGGKEIAYTFRARTHSEMLAWHEEIDRLSRDTKTASDQRVVVSRDPVSAAIANVGLEDPSQAQDLGVAVPGDRVLTGEEAERAQAEADKNAAAATSTFGEGAVAPSNKSVIIAAPGESVAAPHHDDEEESDEEGGGSSEEEYASDDELARTRTAPTTPAAGAAVDHNPLEHDHIHSEESGPQQMKAETLPAYVGSGVSQAEKAALTTESKSAPPPVLGEPIATSSHAGDHHTEQTVESTTA